MRVLTGAVVHDLRFEGSRPSRPPDAVAIDGDSIVAVGRRDEVLARAGAGAEITDYAGAAIVPGFVDAHHHLLYGVLIGGALPCGPGVAPTVRLLQDLVRREAPRIPDGEWLCGYGYDEMKMDRRPTAADLDAACPDRPCFLVQYSCHEGIANTRALELAGIDAHTPDPRNGRIERDRRGRPTGRLVEGAMARCEGAARLSLARTTPRRRLHEWMRTQQARIFAAGITRIADACVTPDLFALYREIRDAGELRVPVAMMPFAPGAQFGGAEGWLDHGPTGQGDDCLRIGPAKWALDGAESCALCMSVGTMLRSAARTFGAALRRGDLATFKAMNRAQVRFEKGVAHAGILMFPRDQLRQMVRDAHERGLTTAMHAIGNEAVELALDTIAALPPPPSLKSPPPRIEHATFVTAEQMKRAADLGVTLVVQPQFMHTMSKPTPPLLGAPLRMLAFRTMFDAGATVAGSSDSPVDALEPLLHLRSAVQRRLPDGLLVEPEEAMTPAEWLRAYTRDAARAAGWDDLCGTLAPGKRADLAILSADPLAPSADLDSLRVVETILGGQRVHPG